MASRAFVLPLSGVSTVLGSRFVVDMTGSEGYGWFSLLVSLPLLIPISDFGIGSALTDEIATNGVQTRSFRRTLRRVLSLLNWIALGVSCIGVILALAGTWSIILNVKTGTSVEVQCAIICIFTAISIPLGAAQRVMLALGRQAQSTLILGVGGPLSLGGVVLLAALNERNFANYALAFSFGPIASQIVLAIAARNVLFKEQQNGALNPPSVGSKLGKRVSIVRAAVPMAVITLCLPLAYQTDRPLLSHLGDAEQLAEYSLVALLYTPLLSILNVGGQALWPLFMSQTDLLERRRLYRFANLAFAGIGVVLAAALVTVGPFIADVVMSNRPGHSVGPGLYWSFGVLLFLLALHTANGMLLLDFKGRVLQAVGAFCMVPVKVAMAFLLVPLAGAVGVIASTVVAALICLAIPAAFAARKRFIPSQIGAD